MDGLGALPFTKVNIPSGGGLAFKIPAEDGDKPEVLAEITGVILDHHPVNAYWGSKFTGGNNAPDCSSYDGKQGIDKFTGDIRECASCPYNQFGSDENNGGKACKNMHRVFFLREGSPVPLVFHLPPTSIKYIRDYIAKRIIFQRLRCWQAVTKITLSEENSKKGIAYSHVVFTFAGKLSPEKAKEAEAMRNCIVKQYRQIDTEDLYQDGGTDGFMNIPDGDVPQFDS